jgi:hypothetical protein
MVRILGGIRDNSMKIDPSEITRQAIATELVRVFCHFGAKSDLLQFVGSYGDTLHDHEVWGHLRKWNALNNPGAEREAPADTTAGIAEEIAIALEGFRAPLSLVEATQRWQAGTDHAAYLVDLQQWTRFATGGDKDDGNV